MYSAIAHNKRRIGLWMILSGALFFVAFVSSAAAFTDVTAEHKHTIAIQYLQEQKIIDGYSDSTFRPDTLINRAEALKIVLASAGTALTPFDQSSFSDVLPVDWFFVYAEPAYHLDIVRGDGATRQFIPHRPVNRAEFIKMLLRAHSIAINPRFSADLFPDVPRQAWFAPYLNYAAELGLIWPDGKRKLHPEDWLTRSEVAQIIYLLQMVRHGDDPDFLLQQAQLQLAQIELYMAAGRIASAQTTTELVIDFTTQALVATPDLPQAKGLQKLGMAYQLLLKAFVAGLNGETEALQSLAHQAITIATAAWEADHDTQPVAKQIKERANDLLDQTENAQP